jgi:hypothetical protein
MPDWGAISSLSEISSVSLEFTYLARWVCSRIMPAAAQPAKGVTAVLLGNTDMDRASYLHH